MMRMNILLPSRRQHISLQAQHCSSDLQEYLPFSGEALHGLCRLSGDTLNLPSPNGHFECFPSEKLEFLSYHQMPFLMCHSTRSLSSFNRFRLVGVPPVLKPNASSQIPARLKYLHKYRLSIRFWFTKKHGNSFET